MQNNAKEGRLKLDKIWQIKGERVDFDGQINQKINEVLTQNLFWGFLEPTK